MSKEYTGNQGCMSLATCYLEEVPHLARLHRRRCRCRCRAYAPMSNTASHDNHENINSWVSLSFLYFYGALLGGHWISANKGSLVLQVNTLCTDQVYLHVKIWFKFLYKNQGQIFALM